MNMTILTLVGYCLVFGSDEVRCQMVHNLRSNCKVRGRSRGLSLGGDCVLWLRDKHVSHNLKGNNCTRVVWESWTRSTTHAITRTGWRPHASRSPWWRHDSLSALTPTLRVRIRADLFVVGWAHNFSEHALPVELSLCVQMIYELFVGE